MDPKFNKHKNIEDNKPLIDQVDQIGIQDNDTRINLNPDIKIINIKKKGKTFFFFFYFKEIKAFY
jgi:hypothetical protein